MVKKSPHELNLKELRKLAKIKNERVCVSINKMKKDDLIEYLFKNEPQDVHDYARQKKVNELRRQAKKKKEKECKTYGKMDKNELIEYIYGYDVPKEGKKVDKKVDKEEKQVKKKKFLKDLCLGLAKIKNSESDILKNRNKIYDILSKKVKSDLTSGSFDVKITNKVLTEMFHLYDRYFFENKITEKSKENKCRWEICWNERCIGDAGGVCNYLMSECIVLKIELNRSVFKKSLRQIKKDTKLENGGIQCDNLLSCLQLTFEHEMVHGIMRCMCPRYQYGVAKDQIGNWTGPSGTVSSGHGKTFMSIVNNVFGHTDWKHRLTWSKSEYENNDKAIKMAVKVKEAIEVGDTIKVRMMKAEGLKVVDMIVKKKNPKTVIAQMKEGKKDEFRIYYTSILDVVGKNLVSKKVSDKKKKLTKKRK